MKKIVLNGNSLTLDSFREIVEERVLVTLDEPTREKIQKARHIVEKAAESDKRVYAVNTGFGILSKVSIPRKDLEQLQTNIIRSHSCSVGDSHTEEESRAILLLRTNTLAKGYSGVRIDIVEQLVAMLNHQIHPLIPQKGSVGASGDLSPLAHLASVVIGEGQAYYKGKILPGEKALRSVGLKPIKLSFKEGISLINGTQQMTGSGALTYIWAEELVDLADLICATSLEGVLGSPEAYLEWIQASRPHSGQVLSAKKLLMFMQESEIRESHLDCERVQDPYSFRCAPQVHGAVRDLLAHVKQTLTTELNAATDNPIINIETGEMTSNGNFHGQPVAFALDILAMGLSELASISERRTAKLIDPNFTKLPCFLVENEGLNSGFMMAQVTAASLVSENKLLTHPGSTDSIPTNNEKEDHVSMGPICARKAAEILKNTQNVLAIELLAALQALEFRKPLQPGKGPRLMRDLVREKVPPLDQDRYLHKDIEAVAELIRSGRLYGHAIQEGFA